ncbi:hypothetical protein CAP35_15240 [Chitinophagaceae bacterium IBVUCB1]|nr:hypothetical protein CAP35_15240 [Chitinophagaceae bacterium IBVUCB1]
MRIRIIIGIALPAILIIMYLLGSFGIKELNWIWIENASINSMLQFQVYGLLLSAISILITVAVSRNSIALLRVGNLSSPAKPVKLLLIREGDNWYKTGFSYLVGITIVTTLFMYGGLADKLQWHLLTDMLPWVILFSVTNSFNEEIITRFSTVGMLDGVLKPLHIIWISASVFGLVHYFGSPGGPIGVLMAGFLGWLLAKSVVETRGIGVAWFIHFVQDIVIFGMILIMK